YTPAAGFAGDDFFTYPITDGIPTADATVKVHVISSVVEAGDDSYSVLHDRTLTPEAISAEFAGGVLANDTAPDGAPPALAGHTDPAHGTLTLNDDGTFTYPPAAGFTGTASFTYTVGDGTTSASATVTINVTNQAPVANDDSYRIPHDRALTTSV